MLIEGKASAEELGVISRFIVRGHLERARVSAAGLVERYPVDPVVLALVPRLDAETNRTSFAAAEAEVLWALDGPQGLSWAGAECGALAFELRGAAVAYAGRD